MFMIPIPMDVMYARPIDPALFFVVQLNEGI